MLLVGGQMHNRPPYVTNICFFVVLFLNSHGHYHCFGRPVTSQDIQSHFTVFKPLLGLIPPARERGSTMLVLIEQFEDAIERSEPASVRS